MIVKSAVKGGVLAGSYYYTKELGVWSDTTKSEKLYSECRSAIKPHVDNLKKQLPFDVPELPKSDQMSYLAKHYYNEGIKSTFHTIHMLPCYVGQFAKKSKDLVSNALEAPPPAK